jgi:hypothetical protein
VDGHVAVLRQSGTMDQVINDKNFGRQSITDEALIVRNQAADSLKKIAQRTLSVLTGSYSRANQPYDCAWSLYYDRLHSGLGQY